MTRADVARLAGVSTAVVSYVVNDGPRPVAPATRQRVQEAIDKLGYQPNVVARSLITGRADMIGLIAHDLRNPYFSAVAEAVEVAARERGLTMVLVQSEGEGVDHAVEALAGRMVVGVITVAEPRVESLRRLLRLRLPIVGLSLIPTMPFPSLAPDYYQGANAVVRHLIDVHHHTRIALVTGSDVVEGRERGWRDALSASGLDPSVIVRLPWSMAGGRDAAWFLRAEHPDVTAVFVTSDQQATGLVSGLAAAGVRVPADVAVVSFDGSPESEFVVPPLTTVSVPLRQMSRDAVALVLGETADGREPYPVRQVIRESCGCPGPPRLDVDRGHAVRTPGEEGALTPGAG